MITGHIDFLQIRNGNIHILDYKPDARNEKHAHVQLTIYALALARRTGLPLKFFKCGWFDEKDYFEFYRSKVFTDGETRDENGRIGNTIGPRYSPQAAAAEIFLTSPCLWNRTN